SNCAWNAGFIAAAGNHEEARTELERVIGMDPAHWFPHWELSFLEARGGHLEEALAEAEKAVKLSGEMSLTVALLACCCHAVSDRSRAEALRAQLEERLRKRYVPPLFFSWIASAGKDTEEAVRWLERAAEGKDPWFPFYRVVPPALSSSDSRIEA